MQFINEEKWQIPSSDEDVAAFLANLQKMGLKYTTIRSYLTAIAYVHKVIGDSTEKTSSHLIQATMRGIKNKANAHINKATPITRDILQLLLDSLYKTKFSEYTIKHAKALFLTAYHTCARAGELTVSNIDTHTLKLSDIKQITNNQLKSYKISFNSYKHSRESSHVILNASGGKHCPVVALNEYMSVRNNKVPQLFVNANGTATTIRDFTKLLDVIAKQANVENLTTHSFRRGRATQMHLDNTPEEIIKATGRWRSAAYKGYIAKKRLHLPP